MDKTRKIASERSYDSRFSKTHEGILRNPKRIDEEGVMGEQAFAAYMDLPHDMIERRGPVAYNFVLKDGTRVDVRASSASFARLIVPPAIVLRGKVDAYVLAEIQTITGKVGQRVMGKGDTAFLFPQTDQPKFIVRLRGWATPADLQAVEPVKISQRPEATPVHALTQSQLRPMEELKRHHVPHTRSLFDGMEL